MYRKKLFSQFSQFDLGWLGEDKQTNIIMRFTAIGNLLQFRLITEEMHHAIREIEV